MYFERDLGRQIGLRWPMEAMVSGDLSGLNPNEFLVYVEGRQELVVQQVNDLKAALRGKRTVIVGHNVFMDLMYFYKCFFSALPDKVEDFQRIIHDLFPVVIDTKYLATHNRDNPAMANSSLEQLDVELTRLPFDKVPVIVLHEDHRNYFINTAAHEAGYDSFQTAKVLIRLSAKLEAAGTYVEAPIFLPQAKVFTSAPGPIPSASVIISSDSDYFTSEEECVSLDENHEPTDPRASDSGLGGVSVKPLILQENTNPAETKPSRGKSAHNTRKSNMGEEVNSFAHKGMFDTLLDLPANMDGAGESRAAQEPEQPQFIMMPPFDSHFWEVYGNKLRVNGTVEGVCNLLGE